MKILGRVVIALSFFAYSLYGVTVEAIVDTKEVVEGNRLQLTLKVTGGKASFPTINEIGGYGVLGTSSSSQYSTSIVNGKSTLQESTSRIFTILPQKALTIPSYSIKVDNKTYQTKPILIKVVKANIPKMNGKEQYKFEMTSHKKSLMVGESFVVQLTISLAQSLGVNQIGEFVPPASDNFLFKEIGKDKQYGVGNFVVIEKKYLVTPQKEGNFTIEHSSAKIGITDRRRRDFFGRYGTKWLSIHSNSLPLTIRPLPLNTELVGSFGISSHLDRNETKENKPVNLTITLEGKGSLEDFEFPKYEIDGVTVYSKEALVDTKLINGEVISRYTQSFAFIASESFEIPSITLHCYNPQTKKRDTFSTKAYHVKVMQSKHHETLNRTNMVQSNSVVPALAPKVITKTVEVKKVDKVMLLAMFLLGVVITLLIQWIMAFKGKKEVKFSEANALKLLYGNMSKSSEIEEMAKKLYARSKGNKEVKIDKKALKRMFNELNT